MAKYRVGHNAKARSSGVQKKLQLQRDRLPRKMRLENQSIDSEASKPKDEIDQVIQNMPAKKRKRFEKYLDNKRKKDEANSYMQELAELHKSKISGLLNFKEMAHKPASNKDRNPIIDDASEDSSSHTQSDEDEHSNSQQISKEKVEFHVDNATTSFLSRIKKNLQKSKPSYTWRARLELQNSKKEDDATESSEESSAEDDETRSSGASDNSSSDNGESESENSNSAGSDSESELLDTGKATSQPSFLETALALKNKNLEDNNSTPLSSSILNTVPQLEEDDERPVRNRNPQEKIRRRSSSTSSSEDNTVTPLVKARQRTIYRNIERSEAINKVRMKLPILPEEAKIMEKIFSHDCVLIQGETGSGKTTQIPQFLFEYGFAHSDSEFSGMIGVTQPRRLAAISTSKRVSEELGSQHSPEVAYQVRYDSSTISPSTKIKFMTDGILLREVATDFMLEKYSAIIIDEAHERSVNTDILIGFLSRIVRFRRQKSQEPESKIKPLKLIIMSATLELDCFVNNKSLFPDPIPLIKINSRQHPVTTHFNKITSEKYLHETHSKICQIHKKLPDGGILVFLTSQQEIKWLLEKLESTFSALGTKRKQYSFSINPEVTAFEDEDFAADFMDDIDFDSNARSDSDSESELGNALHVLPLYSLLPVEVQMQVFKPPPSGSRLCVLATNIAETSLTIPNIKYVVDCGKSKIKRYDATRGVTHYEIDWISKSNAKQRAGRAGRDGPGHCYRLYSSAMFDHSFAEHPSPEIERTSIDNVVLLMKSLGIKSIIDFPLPSSPDLEKLEASENMLKNLGALDEDMSITMLGKAMSVFPLPPRFSKMMLLARKHNCIDFMIIIVSALSVGEIFDLHSGANRNTWLPFAKLDPMCDALLLLSVVCAFEFESKKLSFCEQFDLVHKNLVEVCKIRNQLIAISKKCIKGTENINTTKITKQPTKDQITAIRLIIAAAYLDKVAHYTGKGKQYELLLKSGKVIANVHSSSLLSRQKSMPEYVVYDTVINTEKGLSFFPLAYLSYSELAQTKSSTKS